VRLRGLVNSGPRDSVLVFSAWGVTHERIGSLKPFTESTDHKALGLSGASSIAFIKEMFGAQRLFIRATPFNESAVTGEFNISGLDDAIKPLRKACGWVESSTTSSPKVTPVAPPLPTSPRAN